MEISAALWADKAQEELYYFIWLLLPHCVMLLVGQQEGHSACKK